MAHHPNAMAALLSSHSPVAECGEVQLLISESKSALAFANKCDDTYFAGWPFRCAVRTANEGLQLRHAA